MRRRDPRMDIRRVLVGLELREPALADQLQQLRDVVARRVHGPANPVCLHRRGLAGQQYRHGVVGLGRQPLIELPMFQPDKHVTLVPSGMGEQRYCR